MAFLWLILNPSKVSCLLVSEVLQSSFFITQFFLGKLSNIILYLFRHSSLSSVFSTASILVLPLLSWLSLIRDHPAWNIVVLLITRNGVCFVYYKVPEFWLCARSPALSKFCSWDLHLCACFFGFFGFCFGVFLGFFLLVCFVWGDSFDYLNLLQCFPL